MRGQEQTAELLMADERMRQKGSGRFQSLEEGGLELEKRS